MNKLAGIIVVAGVGLIALGVAGYVSGWFGRPGPDDAKPGATAPAKAPNVVTPQRRQTVQPGQAEPFESIPIVPKITGYLQAYGKDIDGKEIDTGGRVEAGQLLLTLAVPELGKELKLKKATLEEAQQNLQAAGERVKAAEKDRDKYDAEARFRESEFLRYEKLFKDKSIDKSLWDEKRNQHEAAKAALESADAKIRQYKAEVAVARSRISVAEADVERVADLVGYLTLRAPANDPKALYGVARRWADPGAYLQPGAGTQRDAVLSLVRIDKVRVTLNVPELDAARVRLGDRAIFQPGTLPAQSFEGKVSRSANVLDPQTRTMRVEIDFPNADGKPLAPGMYGSVTLFLGEQQDIWLLPSACVRKEEGKRVVHLLVKGEVVKLPVTVGYDDGTQIEVVGTLKKDSQVVR
jgi:multidrug efflux pump subunit AcrA (membrane-fusion protein)